MKGRPASLIGACVVSALMWTPGLVWAAQAPNPDHHHEACPGWAMGHMAGGGGAGPIASDAKLDELVKKMNDASGTAKVDAMAELLTVLANDHRVMGRHMADMKMMSMMDHQAMMNMMNNPGMMRGMPGMNRGAAPPDTPAPEATQPKK